MLCKHLKSTLAALLFLLSAVLAVTGTQEEPERKEIDSRSARLLANSLPLMHLNKVEWNDELATEALEIFLESLDFEKVFFLKSDVDEFRTRATELDDDIKKGDLQFAYDVYTRFRERVEDRVAYVDELLAKGFDFSIDESYAWKRKEADWADGREAWNELWRKKIKNQYLARIIGDELGEEEKETPADTPDAEEDEDRTHSDIVNEQLDPEAFVRKSYNRYLTVIKDNDDSWVAERFLTSFARVFDPHTDFLSKNNLEDFEINMSLSLVGIGALLSNEDGAAKVERLIPGGPAEQDGRLQPGDKIIAVAQGDEEPVDVLHWPLYRTVRLIRGEKDTRVVLHVIPASDPTGTRVDEIDIVRDEVKLEEQAAKGELKTMEGQASGKTHSIGVITLPEFYADLSGARNDEERRSCTRDVRLILEDLIEQGAEGIILDLRNNGGGSLAEAIEMTGLFIETGPVVQVKDRNRVRPIYDRNPEKIYEGPLAVLVNRFSASASEIVAGALQDYGRAVIIGDSKTHGKGTVQSLAPLSSANPKLGSVKVTTASFYRIAGGSTQLKGIEPDIVIPSVLETMEIGEETLPHALPYSMVEPVEYESSIQLKSILPTLLERSEERRSLDERFSTYQNLMSRLDERNKKELLTLKLDNRLAFAREEKELEKQIEEKAPASTAGETEDDKKKNDLVMSEALQIVSDLIELAPADPMVTDAKTQASGGNSLF